MIREPYRSRFSEKKTQLVARWIRRCIRGCARSFPHRNCICSGAAGIIPRSAGWHSWQTGNSNFSCRATCPPIIIPRARRRYRVAPACSQPDPTGTCAALTSITLELRSRGRGTTLEIPGSRVSRDSCPQTMLDLRGSFQLRRQEAESDQVQRKRLLHWPRYLVPPFSPSFSLSPKGNHGLGKGSDGG